MPYEFSLDIKEIIEEAEAEKIAEKENIQFKLRQAIRLLLKNDSDLLENDVNERSIAHKLAEYLQIQFPDHNVDCEYNKNGDFTKELLGLKQALKNIPECSNHVATDRVLPDIIVHKRKTHDQNLLVIEIKKRVNPTSSKCDEKKLELFTQEGSYNYSFGVFIRFDHLKNPECQWFYKGKKITLFS